MLLMKTCRIGVIEMSSREEFEAWVDSKGFRRACSGDDHAQGIHIYWMAWQASRAHESDLLAALIAITNSGPDAIPIKEAFEMAHRAIERATGGKV